MDTSSVVSFVIIGIILISASVAGYYFVKNGELIRKNQLLELILKTSSDTKEKVFSLLNTMSIKEIDNISEYLTIYFQEHFSEMMFNLQEGFLLISTKIEMPKKQERLENIFEGLIENRQMPVLAPKLSQKFYWNNGEYKLVKSIKIKRKTKPAQLNVNLQGKNQLVFLN